MVASALELERQITLTNVWYSTRWLETTLLTGFIESLTLLFYVTVYV